MLAVRQRCFTNVISCYTSLCLSLLYLCRSCNKSAFTVYVVSLHYTSTNEFERMRNAYVMSIHCVPPSLFRNVVITFLLAVRYILYERVPTHECAHVRHVLCACIEAAVIILLREFVK